MAPAVQVAMDLGGGEVHALSRTELLNRYRRYSAIRRDIQSAALDSVATSRLLAHARRIGLSDGKVLFTDDDVELTFVYDLAVYTSEPGRTRAIDRCARKRAPVSDPEEALVLGALQAARFSVLAVVGKCGPAGVRVKDLMRGDDLVLLDLGLEQTAKTGEVFAIRIAPIEDFVISCGAIAPLGAQAFMDVIHFLTDGAPDADLAPLADDRRFAASLYKMAIEFGLMDRVDYR